METDASWSRYKSLRVRTPPGSCRRPSELLYHGARRLQTAIKSPFCYLAILHKMKAKADTAVMQQQASKSSKEQLLTCSRGSASCCAASAQATSSRGAGGSARGMSSLSTTSASTSCSTSLPAVPMRGRSAWSGRCCSWRCCCTASGRALCSGGSTCSTCPGLCCCGGNMGCPWFSSPWGSLLLLLLLLTDGLGAECAQVAGEHVQGL
eukprot:954095-Pelagomonas_calceolata.AAC.1